MTDAQRLYEVLAEHPRGVFSDTLAIMAEVNVKHISSIASKASRYCPHGKKIEGTTTRPGGITQTKYRIVRDYNAAEPQTELIESEVV